MIKSYKKHIIAFVLLLLLVAVRLFEKQLFNDGLIQFFQHNYLTEKLPFVPKNTILLTDSLRYWLNTLISIAILKLYFNQRDLNKFLFLIYTVFFLVAIFVFNYALSHYQSGDYLLLFYVRRFLIQPLLLFILLPALLYQQKITKQ